MPEGWLFLIAERAGAGWLISVGAEPERNLERSELIGRRVRTVSRETAEFSSHPLVHWPLSGAGWLACGSAALRFDPICGDGAGHAVREAVLAAAAIRANNMTENVLAHYPMRLLGGFQRHLQVCRGFNASGGETSWWAAELAAVDRGIEWCARELAAAPPMHYRLNGFDLEAIR